jgi:hypothetical protein
VQLVFNELCLGTLSGSVVEARARMSRFLQVAKVAATNKGITKTITTPKAFRSSELASGYVVQQWVRDHEAVVKTERDYFLTIATKGPYCEEVWKQLVASTECECECEGQVALGLGTAYLTESASIALDGVEAFASGTASVRFSYVDDCDVVTEEGDVCCLSTIGHLKQCEGWLDELVRRESEVANGIDLWRRRATRLPDLILCEGCQNFIEGLGGGEPRFKAILRHLDVINDTAKTWRTGELSPKGILWSSEGSQTMKHPVYGEMRKIRCPDGKYREFSAHSKLIGLNLRIYFYGEVSGQQRQVFIGYVGPHLPTVKY